MPSPVLMAPLVVNGKMRLGAEQVKLSRPHLDCRNTAAASVHDQQVGRVELVEALDRGILERGLEQGVQHVEAGLVGGIPGSLHLHAAERTHGDAPVRLAAPRAAPMFHAGKFPRRLPDEQVDRVLIAQPVAAGDGVVEVVVEAVLVLGDAGSPALGGDGVAAHGIDLGQQRDPKTGVCLGDGNGGPETGATGADDDDVRCGQVHDVRSATTFW